ncbi:nuclear transport factor 2 family protein [Belliella sp. DSM 111904]|uniref:Nuclear transport factor 2 family protein n=1 Tax=Belliella filtrata TaxID=2923435 RepID=A0ABS9UVD3_9BACT|nr:nuclear transport factor 2 family protein [Belliella filtrata]MCH7407910.1 nuclear transport factor 2 family protein [Belliella filtrata]
MDKEEIIKPVKALIEAMEVEGAELIRSQFSPKFTQAYGTFGQMKSPDAASKWLESDIISRKGKFQNPVYTVESENQVVVKGQYASIGYSNKANFLFTVREGLITSWRMRY